MTSRVSRGFTLIELLLVMAILAIVSAIVVPSFARSMSGNRLRVATRTMVKAGRYARSIAVLRQSPVTLSFDLNTSTISAGDGKDMISRKFDRVTIESVSVGGDDGEEEETRGIVYQTNGRCTPYRVRLVDSDGSVSTITVDALATAETEAGDE